MSIKTYDELVTAVGKWVKRKDLADMTTDFITIFETRANRVLRTMAQRTYVTIPVVGNVAALPADYLESISLDDGKDELKFKTTLGYGPSQPHSGFYAIENGGIRVSGTTGSLNLRYYARFPALSTTNPSNWLLANGPDAYLWGTLTEVEPFLYNDARMALWKDRGDSALNSIQVADDQARFSGGTLSIGLPR
jgi:hypothetical protein